MENKKMDEMEVALSENFVSVNATQRLVGEIIEEYFVSIDVSEKIKDDFAIYYKNLQAKMNIIYDMLELVKLKTDTVLE